MDVALVNCIALTALVLRIVFLSVDSPTNFQQRKNPHCKMRVLLNNRFEVGVGLVLRLVRSAAEQIVDLECV